MFQALDYKGRSFLDLLNDDLNIIKPSYFKEGSWLKHFSHSNSLCATVIRAIVNYAPISEYHLRFFSQENFVCLCSLYPIKSRRHILHKCKKLNNYWNPRRDTLSYFILFLGFNSKAFSFGKYIT